MLPNKLPTFFLRSAKQGYPPPHQHRQPRTWRERPFKPAEHLFSEQKTPPIGLAQAFYTLMVITRNKKTGL